MGSLPAWVAAENRNSAVTGDPATGRQKLDAERCLECHDSKGNESSQGAVNKFATLSGQLEIYIVKQVHDFRDGRRQYDFMTMMAKSLTEQDLADIAAFFGHQNPMQGDGSGQNEHASDLFQNGDANRHIVACVTCHGPQGQGQVAGKVIYPAIAGQQWLYLEQQLRDWRSGERNNSTGNVMGNTVRLLTDEEIVLLSHYIAGL